MPRSYRPPPGTPTPGNTNTPNPNTGKPGQPIRVAPGGPQGQRQQLVDAQRAQPLPDSEEQMQMAFQEAQALQPPADPMRPSEYPAEPITTGMPIGAGAGPSVNTPAFDPTEREDITKLVPFMPMLELLASKPGSSVATRNWVRRLRSQMPPDVQYGMQ